MAPPVASRLDRRVLIQFPEVVTDEFGQPITIWHDLATVYARKEDVRSGERFSAQQVIAERTSVFTIRWRPDITPLMRLVHDEIAMNITGIAELGRREGLELTTELAPPDAGGFNPVLLDFGEDNDGTADRHYTIVADGVLNVTTAGNPLGAWGWFARLSQNDGTALQAMLSSGAVGSDPNWNGFIHEAQHATEPPNSWAFALSAGQPHLITSAADAVPIGTTVLVVTRYDATLGDLELITCIAGEEAVSHGVQNITFGGDFVAPTAWHFGTFAAGGTSDDYYQEEMGELWKLNRWPSIPEIEALAAGLETPGTVFDPDLGGWWRFQDGPVAVEPDVTPNGNDATRQGTWPS